MKIKEIVRTANVAWSPSSQFPVYLAAATAAQQLDSSFSTSSCLELYSLDLGVADHSMEIAGSICISDRLHKLAWSPQLNSQESSLPDLLIGGAEQGRLYLWNPQGILTGQESLVEMLDKHVGAVAALDVNPFQVNLLASGAGDSEIFIWDLHNPDKPMTPGSKAQPYSDVTCVAWNKQVQHILASSQDGNCVVWDLRKNEPIIKIRDSMSRMKCSSMCWHPDVATQLCIASEDDHTPAIQLWDLRSASSPFKQLENHTRGVLSMAWCPHDSDLLLSCAKDNRILCWNPNSDHQTGEVVCELPNTSQWCFDVQWCPRNPGIVSGCSFDGHVSVYSINEATELHPDRVAEAFSTGAVPNTTTIPGSMLKNAPKWLKKPCGASFAFGGKLVSFNSSKVAGSSNRCVSELFISQVVTEPSLVSRSEELEAALNSDSLIEYCDRRVEEMGGSGEGGSEQNGAEIWKYLKVSLEPGPQTKYLKLLGSDRNVAAETTSSNKKIDRDATVENNIDTRQRAIDGSTEEEEEKTVERRPPLSIGAGTDAERLITRALLSANFEAAVAICVENELLTEAMMLAYVGGRDLFLTTQKSILNKKNSSFHRLISSIVNHDIESIVRDYDLETWKEALIVVLTYSRPQELAALCDLLGEKLELSEDPSLRTKAQLCYVVSGNVDKLVSSWQRHGDDNSHYKLQDIIEKVTVLQHSSQKSTQGGFSFSAGSLLVERLVKYAEILSDQGRASVALRFLLSSSDLPAAILKDRSFHSLGLEYASRNRPPPRPFNVVNIKPQLIATKQQSSSSQQHHQHVPKMHLQHVRPSKPVQQTYSPDPASPYPLPTTNLPAPTPSPILYSNYLPNTNNSTGGYMPTDHFPGYGAAEQTRVSGTHGTYVQGHGFKHPPSQAASSDSYYNQTSYSNTSGPLPSNLLASSAEQSSDRTMITTTPWNDPPQVAGIKSSKTDTGSANHSAYRGQLYNPQDYQLQQVQQQQKLSEHVQPPNEVVSRQDSNKQIELPGEHKIIKAVFTELISSCLERTTNLPTKKKLEEISKKMDILYSSLSEESISAPVVSGIHQIVACIQQQDYNMSLAYHSQIVGMGSFSEISSFFPSIKALIQTASQLRVYLQ